MSSCQYLGCEETIMSGYRGPSGSLVKSLIYSRKEPMSSNFVENIDCGS